MALLTKQDIWDADDIVIEDVPVPEWGGEIRIRGLAGHERDEFEGASLKRGKGGSREVNLRNLRARLVAKCVINEDGSLMFTPADVMHLGQKSAKALQRVFEAAQRLSGLADDDVEELVEDFGDDPSASSTSD